MWLRQTTPLRDREEAAVEGDRCDRNGLRDKHHNYIDKIYPSRTQTIIARNYSAERKPPSHPRTTHAHSGYVRAYVCAKFLLTVFSRVQVFRKLDTAKSGLVSVTSIRRFYRHASHDIEGEWFDHTHRTPLHTTINYSVSSILQEVSSFQGVCQTVSFLALPYMH